MSALAAYDLPALRRMDLCRFPCGKPAARTIPLGRDRTYSRTTLPFGGERSGAWPVKLTVTPIGGHGRSAAAVARAVVRYLSGMAKDPAVGVLGAAGMAAYLADSPEGPGRWLGAGAAFHGLHGVVDREAFQRVLEGRHPVTGERLITAQGSSQRGHLAVGTAARFDDNGEALYTVADAAVLLGVAQRDVEAMIGAGRDNPTPQTRRGSPPSRRPDGIFIADAEIGRLLEHRARAVTAAEVLAGGDPDELLDGRPSGRSC